MEFDPEVLSSDNGPQYTSQAFQDFARELDFKQVTSIVPTTCKAMVLQRDLSLNDQTNAKIKKISQSILSFVDVCATPLFKILKIKIAQCKLYSKDEQQIKTKMKC